MNLADKACIVTGANTGLGFEVAKRLGARGAETTLLRRSERRGEEAIRRIKRFWLEIATLPAGDG